jgi:hypothetical protein
LQLLSNSTPQPDWEAVRHDYEAGQRTVDEICAAHGLSACRLYRRRVRDGWLLRQPARSKAGNQRELSARLAAALDRKMRQYEKRMSRTAASDSAADSERDARTLNTLVRLFEKLTALQYAAPPPVKARGSGPLGPTTAKDTDAPDTLRGELARRLERLRGQIGG